MLTLKSCANGRSLVPTTRSTSRPRPSWTTRWPRRRCSVRCRWVRSLVRSGVATWPTGPPRTVAWSPRWATWWRRRSVGRPRVPEAGSAQIAFMNPGGLRDDMLGTGAPGDPYPRTVTYKQAAEVQPFANGLVNMDLTGAQIKAALEQQWQPVGASRPFLKLGASRGLHLHLRPGRGPGVPDHRDVAQRCADRPGDGLLGDGELVPRHRWRQLPGVDNGARKQDTGQTDLQAMVDYMDEFEHR